MCYKFTDKKLSNNFRIGKASRDATESLFLQCFLPKQSTASIIIYILKDKMPYTIRHYILQHIKVTKFAV